MGLLINTNSAALEAANNLNNNQVNLQNDLTQLSSGLKINSAADNPAGLVISEQMLSQITGLNQAVTNSTNAVSMTQTAEGALDEVNTLLDNARQLTLDAANSGVNDTQQNAADQAELDNVISSITRISQVTQFGTKDLLNGSLDGISAASASLSHINAGNLANNPAIAPGVMTVTVTTGTNPTTTLKSSGITGSATNNYIFSGTVTGIDMGTNKVVSGVSIALTIASKTSTYIATGSMTATQIATKLNAMTGATAAKTLGYKIIATGGQFKVTPIGAVYTSSGFISAISFTRAADPNVTGTNYTSTATVGITTGGATSSGSAHAFFTNTGTSKISGVTASSIVTSGVTFTATVQESGGSQYQVTYKVSGSTTTMATVLSGLASKLAALTGTTAFSGATMKIATGSAAGAFKVALSQEASQKKTFDFSLTADIKNAPVTKSNVVIASMAAANFSSGTTASGLHGTLGETATTKFTGSVITSGTYLKAGNALEVVVSGHTIVLTGGRTMTQLATALQTALNNDHLSGVKVIFGASGTKLGNLTNEVGLTTGTALAKVGFVFYNTGGAALQVSVKVDQADGTDVVLSGSHQVTGQNSKTSLDLTTYSTSLALTEDGHKASTVASSTGRDTIVAGVATSATLATTTGLSLKLAFTNVKTSGAATLVLSSGAITAGFNGLSIEVTSGLALGGHATFTLGQGAIFQVGANAGQTVGLTIQSTASSELGRNADSKLSSLEDLASSSASALTTGQTTGALNVIDAAIDQVTNLRGQLGAFQSDTLQAGLSSLQVADQNLTTAQGTIVDVDFAAASADFSKNQILVQSSTAMLAQANQLPQNVLKLLG